MAKVFVGGSREPTQAMVRACVEYMQALPADTTIIHGDAAGIDAVADSMARQRWFVVDPRPPDYARWRHNPRQAPLERNKEMADACDQAVFFWDGESRGTWHAINEVRKRGKPLDVFVLGHKVEDPSTLKLKQTRHPRKEVELL